MFIHKPTAARLLAGISLGCILALAALAEPPNGTGNGGGGGEDPPPPVTYTVTWLGKVDEATYPGGVNQAEICVGTIRNNSVPRGSISCEECAGDVADGEMNDVDLLITVQSLISANQSRGGKKATFSINDAVVSEPVAGTVEATFTVFRSGDTSITSYVDYSTVDGTATAGNGDFVVTGGTLEFAPDVTRMDVIVTVNANTGDPDDLGDETFYVELSNPVGATIKRSQGKGTIRNTAQDATPMFVSSIEVIPHSRGPHTDYGFVIEVLDGNGEHVAGVGVIVKLSDPEIPADEHDHIIRHFIGDTGEDGKMTTQFMMGLEPGKTYNVEVIDLDLDGYIWNPEASTYELDGDDDDFFPELDFTP